MKRPTPPKIDQRRAQWLKGVLDLCVLARLGAGEAYGYELSKGLQAGGFGEIKGGTLYPLLNRLERDGLVITRWKVSDQGPDRKYYQLTESGKASLTEASAAWLDFSRAAQSMLTNSEKGSK